MPTSSIMLRLASAACLVLTGLTAHADGGRAMPGAVPPAYGAECASCHMAYPPGLLPAPSWQRLMAGLDRHFGTDASLDAATVQHLSRWLQANAGTGQRAGAEPPQDRITRSPWFERKHRKVDAATWKLASVRTASNCAACHSGAERGSFDEHALRMPAGLAPGQQRAWND
ncbi:diheme cytochrome c [Caenimonas terrae]|uniref:Diheme cytochrome c n=1 Tax=Caenimonas terrae TaxID=696074 RepID=A0ABW0NC92_9BURK